VVAPPASRPAVPGSVQQAPRVPAEAVPPAAVTLRREAMRREQSFARRQARPVPRPAPPVVEAPLISRPSVPGSVPAPRGRIEATPSRGEVRQDKQERPLPGQPASQTYRGRDRENRDAR